MIPSRQGAAHSLEPVVLKRLKKLMKPIKVSGLVFTKCDRRTVRGIILTKSPTERREVARDFEVGGLKGCSIGYATVDGKKVFLRRAKRISSRRSTTHTRSRRRQQRAIQTALTMVR